jgi:hypothetical protein
MTIQSASGTVRVGNKKILYSYDYMTCGDTNHRFQTKAMLDDQLNKIAAIRAAYKSKSRPS